MSLTYLWSGQLGVRGSMPLFPQAPHLLQAACCHGRVLVLVWQLQREGAGRR